MTVKNKQLQLERETRAQLIVQVKEFFLNERDEEIGDLAAMLLIDFFSEKVGAAFYNRGVQDAKFYLQDRLEDLYSIEII